MALIHLNDQPVGPVAPDARLQPLVQTPNTVKVWEGWGTAIALTFTKTQCAMLLRTPSPIIPEKGVIY